MLEHVRAGNDMDILLNNFTGADLLLQLSVVPETGRRYDFPFAKGMPLHLLFEGNTYLDSFVYEAVIPQSTPSTTRLERAINGINGVNSTLQGYPITFRQGAYDKPFRAAKMADPMLEKIDVSKWTSVSSDNRVLRKYLGSYFLNPSVLSPVLHKDLFFEDMITGECRFASKLLVNAVLAAGCQSCLDLEDRWMLWNPDNIAYKFLSEFQAALIMNVTYNLNANDFIAIRYLDQACDMAKALDLFGPAGHGLNFVAQGSRQAAVCLTYSRPLKIKKPPAMALPDPMRQPGFYANDIRVQYPLSEQLVSLRMDHKMHLEAQLYRTLGEMASSLPVEKQSLADAFRLKGKLDQWFSKVTELFDPKVLVFPIHFDLHMQYYYWIIRLFQPLIVQTATAAPAPPSSLDGTPQGIVRHSQVMFETLLRIYYLRHSYSTYDAWIIHFLLVLGTNALNSLYDATAPTAFQHPADALSSLLLAVKGLKQQSKNVYIARICALGLQKSMRPDDLQWVRTFLFLKPVTKEDQRMIDESARCSYPVPIVSSEGQLETRKLGEIMKGVEELPVEE
ncbi:uncharacterized protein N0V89_001399 [Didymosphaeria variabile]|uniref:Transcription factor domain-containing protein n=1 Tax=Didymosphaeria variabile TaxID=1932322 RepID=A0A9W8XW26_9PLEO|nr:uncharacterized protein N0V89_001399 [Didymosphaeria variabile]KAJ4360832.1 hypothetical protein N0V89_001399 [Didymosphaeria variabile]